MEWYLKVVKENYANFSGRARRKEYWMFMLFNLIVCLTLFFLMALFEGSIFAYIFLFIYCIYILALIVPSMALIARRMHDTNRSGWAYFMNFIPVVGPFIVLYYVCTEGTSGDNRYGPDPKAEQPTDKNIGIIQ